MKTAGVLKWRAISVPWVFRMAKKKKNPVLLANARVYQRTSDPENNKSEVNLKPVLGKSDPRASLLLLRSN